MLCLYPSFLSLDECDIETYNAICQEWQDRTGFELEEDTISEIVQKDVNNYVEIAADGSTKIKGGQLVRGIAPAGAFNINNNATIVAKAILDYFAKGISVEDTINSCNDLLSFQLVAKASGLYSGVNHIVDGERVPVQKCNRVYAVKNTRYGISASGNAITFIEFGSGVHYAGQAHPKAGEFGFNRGGYGYHLGRFDSWRYSGNPGTNGEVITEGAHKGEVKTQGNPANRALYDSAKEMREQITKIAKEVFGSD